MSKGYHVAITGITGVVGQEILDLLIEREFPIKELSVFASARSAGRKIDFKGQEVEVEELTENSLVPPIDIVFFAAGGDMSAKYSPAASEKGITVIDNSSHFRMDEDIKLIVPEVNGDTLTKDDHLIANPNCSTIQSVVPLKVLDDNYGLKRVIYNTYQAVSGAGAAGIKDLEEGTTDNFPFLITETAIPQIDDFTESGYTKEELKMIDESRKILGHDDLPVTATAIRVPIKNSHGVSINAELKKDVDLETLRQQIEDFPGLKLVDNPAKQEYPLQSEASGIDDILVGRLRHDFSMNNTINLWVVADNIRKGAALNSVQIAEYMVEHDLI